MAARPLFRKQPRREIALAGIGQHGEEDGTGLCGARDFQCGSEGAAAGDTAEDSLLRSQRPSGLESLVIAHRYDAIDDAAIEHLWYEVRRPTLDLVWRETAARQQRRVLRFRSYDLRVRTGELQCLADTRERPACAPTGNKKIEAATGEVPQDLRTCGVAVVGWVRLVFELSGKEPAVLRSEFLSLAHHA